MTQTKKHTHIVLFLSTALIVSALAVIFVLGFGRRIVSAWIWTSNLSAGDVEAVSVWYMTDDGYGETVLSEDEESEFFRLLNSIPETAFTDNKEFAGITPEYGFIITHKGVPHHINQVGFPSLEMSYGRKLWWIDNDKLYSFLEQAIERS